MSNTICYTWAEADLRWDTADYTWNDVCIAIEVSGNVDVFGDWYHAVEQLEPEKKRRFIELVCIVKMQDGTTEKSEERREVLDEINVTVKDIERTVSKILEVTVSATTLTDKE